MLFFFHLCVDYLYIFDGFKSKLCVNEFLVLVAVDYITANNFLSSLLPKS